MVALAALSFFLHSNARAQDQFGVVTYRELYNFCSLNTDGTATAQAAGWLALAPNLTVGKPGALKVFTPGIDLGLGAVNSSPVGIGQGHAFWSKPLYGLTIFTQEYQLNANLLSVVEFDQRLSGINFIGVLDQTRLALLIDSTWYISDTSASQSFNRPVWTRVQFQPRNMTFGTVPFTEGVGPTFPANSGVAYPTSGTLKAVGIFVPEVNGRVRLDNFAVYSSDISSPPAVQTPNIGACAAGTEVEGADPGPPGTREGTADQVPPAPENQAASGVLETTPPVGAIPPSVLLAYAQAIKAGKSVVVRPQLDSGDTNPASVLFSTLITKNGKLKLTGTVRNSEKKPVAAADVSVICFKNPITAQFVVNETVTTTAKGKFTVAVKGQLKKTNCKAITVTGAVQSKVLKFGR